MPRSQKVTLWMSVTTNGLGHSGIACYIDDFLIVADTHAECLETMSILQKTPHALSNMLLDSQIITGAKLD